MLLWYDALQCNMTKYNCWNLKQQDGLHVLYKQRICFTGGRYVCGLIPSVMQMDGLILYTSCLDLIHELVRYSQV